MKPDNIFCSLDKWLPKGQSSGGVGGATENWCAGYYRSLDTFSISLSHQPSFSPPGDLLHSYTAHGDSYCIFKVSCSSTSLCLTPSPSLKATLCVPGMKSYLSRLQPLLLWFIEAASFIGQSHDVSQPQYVTCSHSALNDPHLVLSLQMRKMKSGSST